MTKVFDFAQDGIGIVIPTRLQLLRPSKVVRIKKDRRRYTYVCTMYYVLVCSTMYDCMYVCMYVCMVDATKSGGESPSM